MTAVPFDTLKLARKLEAAGFNTKQAGDTAEALADAMSDQVATKGDLAWLTTKTDLAEAKVEILKWMIGTISFQALAMLGGVFLIVKFVK
jgi:hypothetical protein